MSDKQDLIDEVLQIVVDCCNVEVDGEHVITKAEIVSKRRDDAVCMTRCIFVAQMMCLGFSRTTIAKVVHRSERSIGDLLKKAYEYKKTSYAFRLADAEATLRMKSIVARL